MWYLRIQGDVIGPLSENELRDLARRGGLTAETVTSRDGSVWSEAGGISGLEFASRSTKSLDRASDDEPSRKFRVGAGWIIGGVMGAGAVLLVLGFVALVVIGTLMDRSDSMGSPPADRSGPLQLISHQRSRNIEIREVVSPRLSLRWQDATDELTQLIERLSAEQRTVLRITALTMGFDVYAARVELTNQSAVPILISPEKIRVHFGQEAATVSTLDAPQFLREEVLEPGQATTGLITFVARIDIGAAFRLGSGELSYADPGLEMTDR